MLSSLLRRSAAMLLVCGLVVSGSPVARAQTTDDCFDESAATPEGYGPTDINATTGNGGLSVALNAAGTVTVLKWPSPSFYDQIKYRTTDRSADRMGALPNEGSFLGLAWARAKGPWKFQWLRQWRTNQRYAHDDGDRIVTIYRKRSAGLKVRVTDVVAAHSDVHARRVHIRRRPHSRVRRARVIAFSNFNPVFSKIPQSPTNDWCTEENNDDGGSWAPNADAIVHARSGTDASTGDDSSVAVAMGFGPRSFAHQVGSDTYTGGAGGLSAYDDAGDGKLNGNDSSAGQADAALVDQVSLKRRSARTTVFLTAGPTRKRALRVLSQARRNGMRQIAATKDRWWKKWLSTAKLPRNAPADVTRVAKRSLVSMRQAYDDRRKMIVASIATQPPYGVDSIRDGSYINRAFDIAGHPGLVAPHNVNYGILQAKAGDPPPGGDPIPGGNWAESYYADGVASGDIPFEIDATGLGIWTLWDHYALYGNETYLLRAEVYEAIQRAAHYLSDDPPLGCVDPTTDLQCLANEQGNETPTQTLIGAQAVWLGLDSAARAAAVNHAARGSEAAAENQAKWLARRDDLGAAIDEQFFDAECNCYTDDYETGATFLWPVGFPEYGSERANAQADVNWAHLAAAMAGKLPQGRYESKVLVAHAFAWAGDAAKIDAVRDGLEWVADVPTTPTGLLGEAWARFPLDDEDAPITAMVAQPHVTTHALYYLAAIKAYGKAGYRF